MIDDAGGAQAVIGDTTQPTTETVNGVVYAGLFDCAMFILVVAKADIGCRQTLAEMTTDWKRNSVRSID